MSDGDLKLQKKPCLDTTQSFLPFLFMGQATKYEIRWMAEAVRGLRRACFSDDE